MLADYQGKRNVNSVIPELTCKISQKNKNGCGVNTSMVFPSSWEKEV